MKAFNRSLVLRLISITGILIIILSACQKQNEPGNPSIGEEAANTPAALEPYEVVIYYPGPGTQKDVELVEKEAAKLLKDINVTIKLNCIGMNDWQDKKRMILNSGDKADLIFTASWSEYFEDVGRGAWLPLDSLLAKNGKGITQCLSKEQLSAATVKGSIYAIPVNKEYSAVYGLLFNKSLVDKYNVDLTGIKSLQDLEPLLEEIRVEEAGNGIAPFLLDGYGTPLRIEYMNNYEAIGSDTSAGAIKKSDTSYRVVNQYEQEDIRKAVETVYKWKQKGYFNDFSLDQQSKTDSLRKQGKYLCMMSPLKPGKDKEMTQQYGVEYVQYTWAKPYADTREATGAMMSIPKSCGNPERTMMFLDRLYTDKALVNLLVNGIEGVHYIKKSEDIIGFPPDVNADNSGYLPQNNWQIGSQFLNYIWEGEDPLKWEKFKEFSNRGIKSRIMGFTYSGENIKAKEGKVIDVLAKYFTLYANGMLNPDNSYSEFLNKLKNAGVDDVIAEKQSQLDEWVKENKK